MRCLLVDDSVRFLEQAQRTLQQEGISVMGVATTGAETRELISSQPAELLLLDMDLGAESGLELLSRLAGESRLDGIQVILISAHGEADFAELIQASPAAGFVAKSQLSARAIYDVLAASG
jgi:two-component system nitrate/nitrite response regulator NarL